MTEWWEGFVWAVALWVMADLVIIIVLWGSPWSFYNWLKIVRIARGWGKRKPPRGWPDGP